MQVPQHVFKQYDIRGLIGEDLSPEFARQLGRAFVSFLQKEVEVRPLVVAVGRDMRETSVSYQKALMEGLIEQGADVLDLGLVSTPAFYFGVGHTQAHGGIMVSASHNPAEYNGFKLTRAQAVPISGETGIEDLRELMEADLFQSAQEPGSITSVENVALKAARAEYVHAGDHDIKRLKIVADTANGMGAQYLDYFFDMIDADVARLYWELDGSFPNHEANPFKLENTVDLREAVLESGADLGIATDGDGDRIFFIDNKGRMVNPAIVRGLLAQIVLRDRPGATICYDIRPGKITEDMIREAGGTPSVTRVGHSLIKEQMREEDAPFGGESSGHFFYAFPSGVYEGPVTVAAQMLQEITRQGKSLAEIVEPLERYAHSGEINFEVEDKVEMMDALKERYAQGELSELDGITIHYDDFWFNVRPSNTEPKLRLNLEAVDEETMIARRDEIIAFIKENS